MVLIKSFNLSYHLGSRKKVFFFSGQFTKAFSPLGLLVVKNGYNYKLKSHSFAKNITLSSIL